ncbi:putative U2 small nuclear ribonucleoprotein A' [Ciona intestinalis]
MATIPVVVLTSPVESKQIISPDELPGNDVKFAVWHQIPKNKITGDDLHCPRIRVGPVVSSGSSSSSSSSSDSDADTPRLHLRHNYKSKYENWKKATVVNFSYQDLGHDYQVKNFVRVLKSLESCVQLNLVDNSLADLKAVQLPKCHSLNLRKNYFCSFNDLPVSKELLHLNLCENNISNLKGSEKFKRLKTLDLSLNPIHFEPNYRKRVIAKFPKLEFLDGVLVDVEERDGTFDEGNTCVLM